MPELQPGQFEVIVASFGYTGQNVYMSRQAAERYAAQLVSKSYANSKIIRAYLDSDTSDGSKGRVIAICEPVAPSIGTVYVCSKCGHELVIKPGQITTSDIKMHCGLLMQVQKHQQLYKPDMEYK